ncbi:MAG: hypothetical protein NW208_00905 [Bryobacter sp.]|nr:hypothetical protein [Bryobacter sp.]
MRDALIAALDEYNENELDYLNGAGGDSPATDYPTPEDLAAAATERSEQFREIAAFLVRLDASSGSVGMAEAAAQGWGDLAANPQTKPRFPLEVAR